MEFSSNMTSNFSTKAIIEPGELVVILGINGKVLGMSKFIISGINEWEEIPKYFSSKIKEGVNDGSI